MANLKDILFPDPNISQYNDSLGVVICAGDKLISKEGGPWYVHLVDGKFYVSLEDNLDNINTQKISLPQWILLSNDVEVVTNK